MGEAYRRLVRGGLTAYKGAISPWLPRSCRYLPTCSEYVAAVLVTYGPVEGGWLGLKRLCRCHPWGGAGYDPPPGRPTALKCEA